MSSVLRKLLLSCLAFFVSLLVAELVASAISPQDLSGWWLMQTERGLKVNKSTGMARHQGGDRVVYYRFSPPHLRAPVPDALIRVLVVGDSYTFGWLLDHGDTYVSLLQSKVDAEFGAGVFSLLNAATIGWGVGDYVAFVEDFGEKIDPDLILVFLNTDDLERTLHSPLWDFQVSEAKLTRAHAARNRLKDFMNGLPGYEWLLEHSHVVQLARAAVQHSADGSRAPHVSGASGKGHDVDTGERAVALGVSMFRRLSEWCEKQNVALLVSTTGLHSPPYPPGSSAPTEAFMAVAKSTFLDLDVPFSDPSDVLGQKSADPLTYMIPDDGHPNEEGAALVAQHVFPFIESQLSDYCRETARCATPAGAPAR